ncbi:unnamed protein product [Periconia digitata]|uniref:Uncharacterized protein n=1 Tax=Periconia digitata TaxID=1303443 RepID=A0A9W4UKC0_9PLEO|nr:unnamed protein product [Periconia digitata]
MVNKQRSLPTCSAHDPSANGLCQAHSEHQKDIDYIRRMAQKGSPRVKEMESQFIQVMNQEFEEANDVCEDTTFRNWRINAKTQIDSISREIDTFKKELATKEAAHTQEVNHLQSQYDSLMQNHAAREKNLQKDIEDLGIQTQDRKLKCDQPQSLVVRLRNIMAELLSKIENAETKAAQLQEQVDRLQSTIEYNSRVSDNGLKVYQNKWEYLQSAMIRDAEGYREEISRQALRIEEMQSTIEKQSHEYAETIALQQAQIASLEAGLEMHPHKSQAQPNDKSKDILNTGTEFREGSGIDDHDGVGADGGETSQDPEWFAPDHTSLASTSAPVTRPEPTRGTIMRCVAHIDSANGPIPRAPLYSTACPDDADCENKCCGFVHGDQQTIYAGLIPLLPQHQNHRTGEFGLKDRHGNLLSGPPLYSKPCLYPSCTMFDCGSVHADQQEMYAGLIPLLPENGRARDSGSDLQDKHGNRIVSPPMYSERCIASFCARGSCKYWHPDQQDLYAGLIQLLPKFRDYCY